MQGRESRSATAESTALLHFLVSVFAAFLAQLCSFSLQVAMGGGERKTREGETQERGREREGDARGKDTFSVFGFCSLLRFSGFCFFLGIA